jgi:predicted membrane protein
LVLAPKTDAISLATLGFFIQTFIVPTDFEVQIEFRSWYGNEIFRSYERDGFREIAIWEDEINWEETIRLKY